MRPPVVVLVAALGMLAAGCIAPPEGRDAFSDRMETGGSMTAKESRDDSVGPCSGVGVLPTAGAFCAKRVVRVEGQVAGLSRLDVDLQTFNGNVDLAGGRGDAWSLEAVLTARGASEEEARASLERIAFAWSHVEGGRHFLAAVAETPSPSSGRAASLAVTLPRGLVLVAAAATSNGGIHVEDVATDGLSAHTSNGNVEVDASVTQADLRTSNGQVEAALSPTGPGRISAGTSNGAIHLTLPEDARHGYELDAKTSNGRVTINLRDGETKRPPSNPYYDPQNEASFTTSGYASRAIRSVVHLTTSNGGITVDPQA